MPLLVASSSGAAASSIVRPGLARRHRLLCAVSDAQGCFTEQQQQQPLLQQPRDQPQQAMTALPPPEPPPPEPPPEPPPPQQQHHHQHTLQEQAAHGPRQRRGPPQSAAALTRAFRGLAFKAAAAAAAAATGGAAAAAAEPGGGDDGGAGGGDATASAEEAAAATQALLARAGALCSDLTPQQALHVLYACAKLRLLPPGHPLTAALALQLPAESLAALPPAGLASALWALAVLRHEPPPEWLLAFCRACCNSAGNSGDGGSSGGNDGICVTSDANSDASSVGGADSTDSCDSSGGVGARLALRFNRHQLVQLLWGLGQLRLRPPAEWIGGLLRALRPALRRELSASELANALWALGRLGYRPSGRWCRAWLEASEARLLPRADGWQLASVAAALGALRGSPRPRGAWFVAARARALQLVGERRLRASQAATLLAGLAKRRYAQPPHWVGLVLEALLEDAAGGRAQRHGGSRGGGAAGAATTAAAAGLPLPLPPAPALPSPLPPPPPPPQQQRLAQLAAAAWALPLLLHPSARVWAAQPRSAALLRRLAAAALPLLPGARGPQLVQLAVGFSALGYYPGLQWLKVHENALSTRAAAGGGGPRGSGGELSAANRARLRAALVQLWSA